MRTVRVFTHHTFAPHIRLHSKLPERYPGFEFVEPGQDERRSRYGVAYIKYTLPTAESAHDEDEILSDYELQRRATMQENEQLLDSLEDPLGLGEASHELAEYMDDLEAGVE